MVDRTSRETALAELRAWATPGTRARLIAAAWTAGEHNVVVLAEAAGVTRQTVYTDLAEHGVDPRTQRQETPSMYHPITIDGTTGTEPQDEHTTRAFLEELDRTVRAAGFDREADEEAYLRAQYVLLQQHWVAHAAARWHNTALEWADALAQARADAQRALHLVETRWHALRTARAWQAAHHAWIEAVHQARKALDSWQAALDEARPHIPPALDAAARKVYVEKVPADQRIDIDFDAAAIARTELEETTRERKAITQETLTALRETDVEDN